MTFKISLKDTVTAINVVKNFMPAKQLRLMCGPIRKERYGDVARQKLLNLAQLIDIMPITYEQEDQGDLAIVSLRYTMGGFNWYITEKNVSIDGLVQAYGMCAVRKSKMGYMSINDIISSGATLDLNWTPKTLGTVKKSRELPPVIIPPTLRLVTV